MSRLTVLKRIAPLMLLLTLPLAANAADEGDFNYNYVEGGFVNIDSGAGNQPAGVGNLSGLGVDGSYEVAPNWRLVAGFNTISCCDFRLTNFNIGVGYHRMLVQKLGLFVNAGFVSSNGKYTPSGFSASNNDTGVELSGGVRFIPVEKVEVDGFVSITSGNDFVDSTPSPGVLGMYNFAPQWSVFASYTANADLFYTGVRYEF
ncbi:MAG TPA: outer membrane beta-barrel protein [Gammaproteobacteria bacterium]|nr:outer membrane beta-barrel protein [Gammaproteobacteria bacterium]